MLPSKGYFSAIPCVFYLAGNCERPHCHYRHCARDKFGNSDELEGPSEAVEERSWLGSSLSESFVTEMVVKAVDKAFVEDPKRAEMLNREHIIKTALDKLKQETLTKKINATQKLQASSCGFPSYKPTPIAELNKRHIPVVYAPERPLSAIRKDKGPDEKNQINSSLVSTSSSSDSLKQCNELIQGLKSSINSSASPSSNQRSVTDDNSLDSKDSSFDPYAEICQMGDDDSQLDGKSSVVDSYDEASMSNSETLANTVDTLCGNIFTEFSANGLMSQHGLFGEDQLLKSENDTLNRSEEKSRESTDVVLHTNSNASVGIKIEVKTEENNCSKDGCSKNDIAVDESGYPDNSHKIIIDIEKKGSLKEDSKPHLTKKYEKTSSSEVDKNRTKKSHDSLSKRKHERSSSSSGKDKHGRKHGEKSEEPSRKSKYKGDGTDKEKKPPLPSDQSKKVVDQLKDSSKSKKVEKSGDKKYPKSHEKYDKKDKYKHNEKLKDSKQDHGYKPDCDNVTQKSSSSKSSRQASDQNKGKSIIKSSSKTFPCSTTDGNDDVSKTWKRKAEQDSLQPEKRMKISTKTNLEGHSKHIPRNNYSTEIDIFSESSRKGSGNDYDSSHAVHHESGSDDMDVDSVIYSPTNVDVDSISISSGDSSTHEDNQVIDTRWTMAKEMIQRSSTSKIRIAHVPNVSKLLSAKTKLLSKAPEEPAINRTITTSANTVSEEIPYPKPVRRIAHSGQGQNNRFPTLIHSQEIKVNASIRQHYCNVLYDELSKFLNEEEARKKAAAEEFEIAKRCSLPKIYVNNCSLMLLKIRKSKGKLAKDETVAEKLDSTSTPEYTYGWSLYQCFKKYVMSEDELVLHGYPMSLPGQPNCAYTEKTARRYSVQQPDKPFTRKCVNCGKLYDIDAEGMPTTSNDCFYHWGKLRRIPGRGQVAEKFTCCDGADDAIPCQSSKYHVWSGRNEDCMPGFMKTKEFPSYKEESSAGVYALDCEMCYTTRGLELARLTVVDLNEDVVFDQVVALECPVLDYCTRFSGIDEDKVRQATYSFEEVQQWVLDNIFDKTILVGHSLENDLKVLKIFHKTVVDTSVTFPHKFGFPQKCSLKFLARTMLSMTIQESETGHDSKEDAVVCLKLIMKKLKEDSKIRKPRIIIGWSGKKR